MPMPRFRPCNYPTDSIEHAEEMHRRHSAVADYWDGQVGRTSDDNRCTREWNKHCKLVDIYFNKIMAFKKMIANNTYVATPQPRKYKVGVHFPATLVKGKHIDVGYYEDRDETILATSPEDAVMKYLEMSKVQMDIPDVGLKKGDYFWLRKDEIQYVTAIPR